MMFNPFNLIGDEWMLVTAGNEQSGCNTMTDTMNLVAKLNNAGPLANHNSRKPIEETVTYL